MLKPQVAMLRTTQVKTLVTERMRGSTWMKTRHRILMRDNGLCRCEECKASGRILVAHEVDHVIPLHEGGADADHNLAAINSECHKRKSAAEASRRGGGG
jgi:5-methylcytosine-specific restriction protein A